VEELATSSMLPHLLLDEDKIGEEQDRGRGGRMGKRKAGKG